jgi:hypothetical protein
MKQSVSLITLGVADYERAKAFYKAIGWSPAIEIEETAFFQANGVVLVLWSRARLAADMGVPDDGARWSGVALAHNVASEEEVAGSSRTRESMVPRSSASRPRRSTADMPAASATQTVMCGKSRTTRGSGWPTMAA